MRSVRLSDDGICRRMNAGGGRHFEYLSTFLGLVLAIVLGSKWGNALSLIRRGRWGNAYDANDVEWNRTIFGNWGSTMVSLSGYNHSLLGSNDIQD